MLWEIEIQPLSFHFPLRSFSILFRFKPLAVWRVRSTAKAQAACGTDSYSIIPPRQLSGDRFRWMNGERPPAEFALVRNHRLLYNLFILKVF